MSDLFQEFAAAIGTLPPHGVAALLVLLLYAFQSEVRFGAKARSNAAGVSDRGSTLAVSSASAVPVLGFVLAMKGRMPAPLGTGSSVADPIDSYAIPAPWDRCCA